jgi:uncharacterized membrane protein YphA (DoxX/SURF4 family)
MVDWINIYTKADKKITLFMQEYGILFLRTSLGIIFFWFGFLKFFPGLSPADQIATQTISVLTFGLLKPSVSLILLVYVVKVIRTRSLKK